MSQIAWASSVNAAATRSVARTLNGEFVVSAAQVLASPTLIRRPGDRYTAAGALARMLDGGQVGAVRGRPETRPQGRADAVADGMKERGPRSS